MPSLQIHFPEKETPTTLILNGPRISVGRRPNNTIQILDRTLSASHAEFIAEANGHYRLHDMGSTNGTRVNGESVCDYQLDEACKISFGNVECDFNPETPANSTGEAVEMLPTRAEMSALNEVNLELRRNVDVLREQIDSLKKTISGSAEESVTSSLSAELQQAVMERAELKEKTQRQEREFEHLRSELGVMKRDRANLEAALRDARAEIETRKKGPGEATTLAPPLAPAPLPKPLPVAEALKPAWPKVAAPAKPAAPLPKPSLPPPSVPNLAPAKSPASTGAPTGKPVPKFKTVAPPGT